MPYNVMSTRQQACQMWQNAIKWQMIEWRWRWNRTRHRPNSALGKTQMRNRRAWLARFVIQWQNIHVPIAQIKKNKWILSNEDNNRTQIRSRWFNLWMCCASRSIHYSRLASFACVGGAIEPLFFLSFIYKFAVSLYYRHHTSRRVCMCAMRVHALCWETEKSRT